MDGARVKDRGRCEGTSDMMGQCCGMAGRSAGGHPPASLQPEHSSSSARPKPAVQGRDTSRSSQFSTSPRDLRRNTSNKAREFSPRAVSAQAADKALLSAVDGLDTDGCEDEHELEWFPVDEDLYGLATISVLRDFHALEEGIGCWQSYIRVSRLTISVVLVVMNSFLQAWLLLIIKLYITAPAVLRARAAYGDFEASMYDETVQTENGNSRGIQGHFHQDLFDSMSQDRKEVVCAIPLSEPHFLLTFVVVWSLTCIYDAKCALQSYWNCCLRVPRVGSMKAGVQRLPNATGADRAVRYVVGITRSLRVVLLVLVTLPRVAVSLALLWLGCRWLVATTSFPDLFLNAVALKFVLTFKDVFYVQMIPDRNKRDVQNTFFPPVAMHERPTIRAYAAGLVILPIAVVWSYVYVFKLQAVLPRYRWDVHDVCKEWLAQHLTV